ncbi:unnamed protein product [Orchesella dallaii]|uniref:Peptidase M28 domain-containing protein n=1 Tax=Orchesella dallaii TaxID=48710 RepID=A0ABP1RDB1_9HEXA
MYSIHLSLLLLHLHFYIEGVPTELNNFYQDEKQSDNVVLQIFEQALQDSKCKLVILRPQPLSLYFYESIIQQMLRLQVESKVAPGALIFTTSYANQSGSGFPISKDKYRLFPLKNCGFGVIFSENFEVVEPNDKFLCFFTESRMPILRKDEDYFFIFKSKEKHSTMRFQGKLKHYVEVLIENNVMEIISVSSQSKLVIHTQVSNFHFDELFPDHTKDLNGQFLRISVPNYPSALEISMDNTGHYQATRGLYLFWLRGIERKFNFTCEYFLSSNGGASGALLENGEWSGAIGDVMSGRAHMSVDIAHIFSRIGVVEWASPFAYRGLVFVTHKAKYHLPKSIMFHPFTTAMWGILLTGAVMSGVCLKMMISFLNGFHLDESHINVLPYNYGSSSSSSSFSSWSTSKVASCVVATFLEQAWKPLIGVSSPSLRVLLACWLLFAFVMVSAYKAKLASVMGIPVGSFVPGTFDELLSSEIGIGINALGKGETAYIVFASGGGKTYEKIFMKSLLIPNSTECVIKAAQENFACITGEGVATYAIASSVTCSKNGQSPLQLSRSNANFVEGGVIYQNRWIYRHNFDRTIRNAMNMGLVARWWQWHMDSVKADKRKADKELARTHKDSIATVDDAIKLKKLISCFLCWSSGLMLGGIVLCMESGVNFLEQKSLIIAHSPSETHADDHDGKRLIKYNSKEPAKWMTMEELDQLSGEDKHFIDLTAIGREPKQQAAARRQEIEFQYSKEVLYKSVVEKLLPHLKKESLQKIVNKLSSFHSRDSYYSLGEAEDENWLKNEVQSRVADFKGSSSISFIATPGMPYRRDNIIVRLEGEDSTKKEELIILGAHYDSKGKTKEDRAPGADDNATGCAVLLEVLRLLVQFGKTKLKHTLEFHFYAVGESGSKGSIGVVNNYDGNRKKVKGMLNFDRLGFGSKTIGIVDNRTTNDRETSEGLSSFVRMITKVYTDFPMKEANCSSQCTSDHTSWHLFGYPTAFLTEIEVNPNIRTENDTSNLINFELVHEFAKVGMAFAVELAEPASVVASAPLKSQLEWSALCVSFVGIWLMYY